MERVVGRIQRQNYYIFEVGYTAMKRLDGWIWNFATIFLWCLRFITSQYFKQTFLVKCHLFWVRNSENLEVQKK